VGIVLKVKASGPKKKAAKVTFALHTAAGQRVSVVGDFNDWIRSLTH
jgi:1,4-alpha-glucan branching enzyme